MPRSRLDPPREQSTSTWASHGRLLLGSEAVKVLTHSTLRCSSPDSLDVHHVQASADRHRRLSGKREGVGPRACAGQGVGNPGYSRNCYRAVDRAGLRDHANPP